MVEKDIEELLLNCTAEEVEWILEQEVQEIHEELLCQKWEKMKSYLGGDMTKLM